MGIIVGWDISSIANIIQIAVAPVFLLTGIATLLGVMTSRLGRIIDRARMLPRKIAQLTAHDSKSLIDEETHILLKRSRFINLAISFATASALLICLVIMILFMGSLIDVKIAQILATLFVICMALLIIALSLFFSEIFIATRSMRAGMATVESLLYPAIAPAGSGEDLKDLKKG